MKVANSKKLRKDLNEVMKKFMDEVWPVLDEESENSVEEAKVLLDAKFAEVCKKHGIHDIKSAKKLLS